MPSITFIYSIGNNRKKYYGKLVTFSNSETDLRLQAKQYLKSAISVFRYQHGHSILNAYIYIGTISISYTDVTPNFITIKPDSSDILENEINSFDFYCTRDLYNTTKIYMNGKLLNL
jgi:hypothetical protein